MITIMGFSLPGLRKIALNASVWPWRVWPSDTDLRTLLNRPANLCHLFISNISGNRLYGFERRFFKSVKNALTDLKPHINKLYNLKITPNRPKSCFSQFRGAGPVRGRNGPACGFICKNIYSYRRVTISH